MKHWKKPHINKVYEALTAVATDRIELIDETHAKCHSSSGNKSYDIEWSPGFGSMISNDNSAFYKGELSYPMIAVMMSRNYVVYDKEISAALAGVPWKDVNTKSRNNWDMSVFRVLKDLQDKGIDVDPIKSEAERIYDIICDVKVSHLDDKISQPPLGY